MAAVKKKTAKRKVQEKKVFSVETVVHTRLDRPKALRKKVLELAVDTIQMLKHYREYKNLRKEKFLLIKDLKKDLREINALVKIVEQDSPLTLEEVNNLPYFKKQKEMLEKIEEVRLKAERELEDESKLWEDISSSRPVVKPAPKVPKVEPKPVIAAKPKDQLESELDLLRKKLESI